MKKVLNIAHRGYSALHPENTLRAFHEGMKAGADGFECDLRLTSDGVVVVFHDDDLKRLCKAEGSVETLTWSELKTLKVKDEEAIPSLEELLHEFHTTRINLEIKPSARDAVVVENILRVLTKVRPKGEILFSSFSPEALRSLKIMDPQKKLGKMGILAESKDLHHLEALQSELLADTWNIPKQSFDFKFKTAHPPIWMWTLDQPKDWDRALDPASGVEAIITNQPAMLTDYFGR